MSKSSFWGALAKFLFTTAAPVVIDTLAERGQRGETISDVEVRLLDLEERVEAIEARNKRVEADKAWEGSWTRKLVILGLTYLVIGLFLMLIDVDKPWINAIVPAIGFFLSTLTVPLFKRLWLDMIYKEKADK